MENEKMKGLTPEEMEKIGGGYVTRRSSKLHPFEYVYEVRNDKTGEVIWDKTTEGWAKWSNGNQSEVLKDAAEMDKKVNNPNSPVIPKK